MQKANILDKVYQAFRSEPLHKEDIPLFYKDLEPGRGAPSPRKRMCRVLKVNDNMDDRILFTGYKGCGKSTELNYLQKDIENEFLVLNFSIQEELDPVHLNYIEIFIVTMERLFDAALEYKIDISQDYIKNIQYWIGTKEIEEIREKYNIGAEAEIGTEGSIGIPYLQKFFHKFKLTAKSSGSLKEALKTNIEPRLSDLIEHCNLLINEIRLKLNTINRKDIVIIIEDLDKIPLDRASDLFYNHAHQLTQLRANVVFTFPISLYNSIKFNVIKPYFTSIYELPMVMVNKKDGTDNPAGIQVLRDAVFARMDQNLFDNTDILDALIRISGGCIRDLFRMILEATDNALDYERTTITVADQKRAIQTLKREYEGNIADNTVGNIKYPVEGYFELLVSLAKSKSKKIANTDTLLHMRDNLCVLGYNGEGWCDVHPVVKEILKERNKWDGTQSDA